jgi:hypothetical protein
MGITYIKRLTGSTNNLVYLVTTDTTATATASNYLLDQAENITAINEGEWTWETNDCIMLSASNGISWCSITDDFATLVSFSGAGTNEVIYSGSLVSGNIPKFSGTTGTIIDSGLAPSSTVAQLYAVTSPGSLTAGRVATITDANGTIGQASFAATAVQLSANIKAATTANIGGGGAGPISVVVAGLTAASVVVATIESSSNAVSVLNCTATATGFDVTFSADPGASCLLNYVAFVVAQ